MAEFNAWQLLEGALGGGGLMKIFDYFGNRQPRYVKALTDTIDSLSVQLDRFGTRLNNAEAAVEKCHEAHEKCEEERRVDRLELEDVKRQLISLFDEEVPEYAPKNLKRLGGKR